MNTLVEGTMNFTFYLPNYTFTIRLGHLYV